MRYAFSYLLTPVPFVLLGLSVLLSLLKDTYFVQHYSELIKDSYGWGMLICIYCLAKIRMCAYNQMALWGLICLNVLNGLSDFYDIKDSYIIFSSYIFFTLATLFLLKKYGKFRRT